MPAPPIDNLERLTHWKHKYRCSGRPANLLPFRGKREWDKNAPTCQLDTARRLSMAGIGVPVGPLARSGSRVVDCLS